MTESWGGDQPVVGGSADGRVRVELDPSGRVRDITFDRDVAELREALITAFQRAQDAARAAAEESAGSRYGGLPSAQRLEAAAAEATAAAERRFAEISTVLYDLDRRAEREW